MNQPGLRKVHYGLYGENDRPIEYKYGKPTGASEHVEALIKAQNLAGLADYNNDLKESKYQSH